MGFGRFKRKVDVGASRRTGLESGRYNGLDMNPTPVRRDVVAATLITGLFVGVVLFQALTDTDAAPFIIVSPPARAVSTHGTRPPPKTTTGPAQHVLIISVDGLRPDAIAAAPAPVLSSLMEQGASAAQAETIRPSITLPSHTSMLTGLDFKNHGVVWNNYRPGHIPHPTVFSVSASAGCSTAMLFAKDKFHYLAVPGQVHWIYGPGVPAVIPRPEDVTRPDFRENTGADPSPSPAPKKTDAAPAPEPKVPGPVLTSAADGIARAFQEDWPKAKYHLTFVHFAEPDAVGHGRGWMSRPYLDAVLRVDAAIGRIMETLKSSGELAATAIIVTADHGGNGRQHYVHSMPDTPENVRIPWICVGPGVKSGLVIERPLRTFDTAPTALKFLGLPIPAGIDGRPVDEVLR